MKTLTSSTSKIILDKYRDRNFLSSKTNGIYLNKPEVLFLQSQKPVSALFLQLKAVQPISALSSDAQAELKTVAEPHVAYESKTVHVKFQLQKECLFGEQFFLVGDDPMLGLWNPTSAAPLDWSDGHIWTVELDIPVGKSIQFKFILRVSTGDFVWQPGPDRIFQTWETKNTITVCEDWESAEYQKTTEDDPTVNSGILVADNVTQPEKALVSNMNNMLVAADSDTNLAKIPDKPTAIVAEDIHYCEEDPVLNTSTKMPDGKQISQPVEESLANKDTRTEEVVLGNNVRATVMKNLTAENIGYPKEDSVLNTSSKMLDENQISLPKEESVSNKNRKTEEDVLGNNERAATTKNLASTDVKGNLITGEGDAVLVPGLTPLPVSAEAEIEEEDQKNFPVDASVGINKAMNYSLPEFNEKQEGENDQHEEKKIEIFNDEEQQFDDKLKQMPHLAKQEQQPDGKLLGRDVVQNDMQWGRRTLQTLLANLGLL